MKRLVVIFFTAGLAAFLALFSLGQVVSAHRTTQVDDYTLVIGFHNKPVCVGVPNALDLFVTNSETLSKVNGLESTLKAEIIFGSSKKELALVPQEDQDGAYTAYVLPTRAGDYTWHLFGAINGTPVDVLMTSSPTTFDSASLLSDSAFPGSLTDLASSTSSQMVIVLGLMGVILGLAGLLFGLLAWRKANRVS